MKKYSGACPLNGDGHLLICTFSTFIMKKACKDKEVSCRLANNEFPIKITVKTTIDQQETFELVVFGNAYQKGEAFFLKYDEVLEEGTVRTIVKVAENEALILRGGAVKMRLPFTLDRKMRGSYEMPFGLFETTTFARRIEQTEGLIDILYDFSLDGAPAGTYHLQIIFEEEQK